MNSDRIKFSQLCAELGRGPRFIRNLQTKLHLPILPDSDGYSGEYTAFMEKVIYLRILGVPIDDMLELLEMEKKLLTLLKVDTLSDSPTWYLDSCGHGDDEENRLMLTGYDVGPWVTAESVQYHLDFSCRDKELFTSREMGEDISRVYKHYNKLRDEMVKQINTERPITRAAVDWAARFATSK